MSVDLPTPGSPPKSTSPPATTPPPRIRSNLPIPVVTRGTSAHVISRKRTGDDSQEAGLFTTGVVRSSANVFHCWQAGHRPIHFAEEDPHSWHTYCVLAFIPKRIFSRGQVSVGPSQFAIVGAVYDRARFAESRKYARS